MKTSQDYAKGLEENPKGTITKIILWFIGLSMLVGGIYWVVDLVTTPAQTAKDIVKKTLNADNVLQNYEWFKQQYNDYIAINKKIAEADSAVSRFTKDAGARSGWTFEDKGEYSRLTSIADGLKYQREDIVSKYNARSKMLNRELFKTNDLPAEL